jgi:hypothetical protein
MQEVPVLFEEVLRKNNKIEEKKRIFHFRFSLMWLQLQLEQIGD